MDSIDEIADLGRRAAHARTDALGGLTASHEATDAALAGAIGAATAQAKEAAAARATVLELRERIAELEDGAAPDPDPPDWSTAWV